jgi:YVTN family beta-propeller protein
MIPQAKAISSFEGLPPMHRFLFPILLTALPATAAEAPTLLVLLKGANALGYYSRDGKLLASVPVGEHPHEMAFSPDGRYLYTTDNGTMRMEHPGMGNNQVSIIDVAARRRIGVIDLGKYHRPHGIDVDRSTGHIIVSTEAPDQLVLIDPVKRAVIRTFDNKGRQPHMVTFGPGAKWAYASNSGTNQIAAVNMTSGEVKLINTEAKPQGSVLSKDGRELYVGNSGAASISVIDTAKNQLVTVIQTMKGPNRVALTPDGNTLVYSMQAEKKIGFANPRNRRQLDYVLLPNEPVSCTLSRDGSLAFASAENQDTVYIVSVKDRKIVGEVRTEKGAAPDPVLDFTPSAPKP